jgi:hypothetical protein
MDFRAIYVISRAVSKLMSELTWDVYGDEEMHIPVVRTQKDCRNLDLLSEMMGTLTRMMDTRIKYITQEGKIVREWIESVLEIGERYRRELELVEQWERRLREQEPEREGH